MAKTLGEMASRHEEDEDIRSKEMTLDPGPKAYYFSVRSGLCNAYLAASVVASGWVSTSKVGVMGMAGTALKFRDGAVPMVGDLAGFAGAALEAGDRYIQTRRVAKITDLAPDMAECHTVARMVAQRLTEGLTDVTIATHYDATENPTHGPEGVDREAGVTMCGGVVSCSGAVADGASEEAVMDRFVEAVARYEPSNGGATTAIREVQVNLPVSVILPEANIGPVESSSASAAGLVRSPVKAPTHNVLQQLEAKVEAWEAAARADREKCNVLKSCQRRPPAPGCRFREAPAKVSSGPSRLSGCRRRAETATRSGAKAQDQRGIHAGDGAPSSCYRSAKRHPR